MITINSISGGQTSAYIAANYPSDYDLFALVRIEDKKCLFPDKKLRQMVEDRIQKPFIGTAEMDEIIYTMFDLEQFTGRKITWVSGETFDQVIKSKGGYVPNKIARYCTTELKLRPMFHWWHENINEVVEMRLGFRANEQNRAITKLEGTNKNGVVEFKYIIEINENGRNKWDTKEWYKPKFPLIDAAIFKHDIINFWQDKPVRFAEKNNCVGCHWRVPFLLRQMWESHANKMQWFADQEKKGTWRSDGSYEDFKKWKLQLEFSFDDFGDCDSGVCGL